MRQLQPTPPPPRLAGEQRHRSGQTAPKSEPSRVDPGVLFPTFESGGVHQGCRGIKASRDSTLALGMSESSAKAPLALNSDLGRLTQITSGDEWK